MLGFSGERVLATSHMASGLDYEDALTLQCAISNNEKEIASFDKDFDKTKLIIRIEPPTV
ncbi:type II toxin-antitoxin system VapC family toxin [Candidatus Woesearchaeota archaeon]|nr:type II toxin-antitoxin system VapC family toxin [Candidatus Woesearchaeota archaeon]